MNLSKFLVLGALDLLGEGSGYDILGELDKKQISKWTDIKLGSIYFAIKQLKKAAMILEVRQEQEGAFPIKSIYKITLEGQMCFDKLQEEAFYGLYPYFYGFKLALKFNVRRTGREIVQFAKQAIKRIDKNLKGYEVYLAQTVYDDELYVRHDIALYEQEKLWLQQVIDRYREHP